MSKKLIIAAALVVSIAGVVALQPASATSNNDNLASHCPDHNGHPGKIDGPAAGSSTKLNVDGKEVNVSVASSKKSVSFTDASGEPVKVEFCIKASNKAGGKQTGASGSVYWKNNGGQTPDISYVVVYKVINKVTLQEPGDVEEDKEKPGQEPEANEPEQNGEGAGLPETLPAAGLGGTAATLGVLMSSTALVTAAGRKLLALLQK